VCRLGEVDLLAKQYFREDVYWLKVSGSQKSQGNFTLTTFYNIVIKVETYKTQPDLTQCYNGQRFGHIWVHCNQPSRCLWCGGGHRHRECPVKDNSLKLPKCCNCLSISATTEVDPKEKAEECRPSDTLWLPLHFQNCFSRVILRHRCSKPRPGNSSSWHPSSEEYSRASGRQKHWRWYGYFNHQSPADHDSFIDSRHWRWQVFCHYGSSLWTGHKKIRVTISHVWSFFPSDRKQQYKSPAVLTPVQATGLDALTSRVYWETEPQCNQW